MATTIQSSSAAAIKVRPAANGQARLPEQVSRLVRGELYLAQLEMPARIF